ncbi:MAG: hypothetical protein J6U23_14265 [Clostridiales bacterium]|nr:hypothetical protein [Clostridiales bacterium]
MIKRALSVILVLTVFFGGYALIPKKYNLLPVNDAICATNYGGVYQARVTFTYTRIYTGTDQYGNLVTLTAQKTYLKGRNYSVTSSGYDSTNPFINLKSYLSSNFSRLYH